MNFALDDGRVGAGLDLEAGDAVVVDVVALEVSHAVVEGENADVAAVVNVVATHNRIGVVLHPHARQGVSTYLVVFVGALHERVRRCDGDGKGNEIRVRSKLLSKTTSAEE